MRGRETIPRRQVEVERPSPSEKPEATVVETQRQPFKAEQAVPSVSLAGRFPHRTRQAEEDGRQETVEGGTIREVERALEIPREVELPLERPIEAPRQGAPRELRPKLDFMELAV